MNVDQSPKKHIIIELEQELAEEMFDSLESGELDAELGIELCEMLRKGLRRPEYQPQTLSLSERIFFRILRIVVVTLVISLLVFWSLCATGERHDVRNIQWICVGGCVLGMVGMVVAAVTHKQFAGLKASAVLVGGAGLAWVLVTCLTG
jgi:hypothetical protein